VKNLSETEKNAIIHFNREYSNWFISNKRSLLESEKKLKDFLVLVIDFMSLRELLRRYLQEKSDKNTNLQIFNIDYASMFGVDGLCEPALRHLENERFYWGYFGYSVFAIELPSLALESLRKSTEKYTKSKYSIHKKSLAFEVFLYFQNVITNSSEKNGLASTIKTIKKDIKQHQENITDYASKSREFFDKTVGENIDIKIYRGFHYSSEDNVRTGRYLKNNPNSHLHDSGKSISFTLNKSIAKDFAVNYYANKKFLANWSNRVNENELLLKINNFNPIDFLKSSNRHPAIGCYQVAVKNIIIYSCFPDSGEYEIMTFPENVKLLRYDPVKIS
jgi:hypothetical protein